MELSISRFERKLLDEISAHIEEIVASVEAIREAREHNVSVVEQLRSIRESARHISVQLRSLVRDFRHATEANRSDQELTRAEIQYLDDLNKQLYELHAFLADEIRTSKDVLLRRLKAPDSKMGDFEIDIELDYCLRKNDPDWNDNDENILAHRSEPLISIRIPPNNRDDFPDRHPLLAHPVCALFATLLDPVFTSVEEAVSLKGCARIGEIRIDIVIRQQYFWNVVTGRWEHPDNRHC